MLGGVDGNNAHGAMLTSVEQVESSSHLFTNPLEDNRNSLIFRILSERKCKSILIAQYTNSPGVERDWKMEFPPLPEPRSAFFYKTQILSKFFLVHKSLHTSTKQDFSLIQDRNYTKNGASDDLSCSYWRSKSGQNSTTNSMGRRHKKKTQTQYLVFRSNTESACDHRGWFHADFVSALKTPYGSPDLIFVTNITNYICGEKIVMWRIFSFP